MTVTGTGEPVTQAVPERVSLERYADEWLPRFADSGAGNALVKAQLEVASFYGADAMVRVSSSHVMGDMEVLGRSGKQFIDGCADEKIRVAVPTTTNARCVDFSFSTRLRQPESFVADEKSLRESLAELGLLLTDTCTNYQTVSQPRFGEHVAWGDTGAVIYANSIMGARSNFESGPAALAAGVTGYTPMYGFHLDERRRPTHEIHVSCPLRGLSDWGALGAVIGEAFPGYWNVAEITVGQDDITGDKLKHLGASLASYGSQAMFHVRGATPEARSVDATSALGLPVLEVDRDDLDAIYGRFGGVAASGGPEIHVDVVAFTAPQLSLFELQDVAERLRGRRVNDATKLIITTSPTTRDSLERLGLLAALNEAGAWVLSGVCLYLMDMPQMAKAFGWETIATNSAKLANIVGGYRLDPLLLSTADAIEAAVTGRVAHG